MIPPILLAKSCLLLAELDWRCRLTEDVHPTKNPDTSKLFRLVEDALTGVLYTDGAQVTTIVARKVYAGRQDDRGRVPIPRAEISVQPDRSGVRTVVRGGAVEAVGAPPWRSSATAAAQTVSTNDAVSAGQGR